jgi:glycine cleavage system H protein
MIKYNYYYTKTHEWASFDGDIVSVGLTDHAVHQLGDIVYLELPTIGTVVKQEKSFGVIESVKAASDIFSPVNGIVTESNTNLSSSLDLFQKDPYKQAWIIKIKVENPLDKTNLLCYDEYNKFINEEDKI